MYYPLAQQEFESYLNGYDRENDRIKLKIIHTYGVVKQAEELTLYHFRPIITTVVTVQVMTGSTI